MKVEVKKVYPVILGLFILVALLGIVCFLFSRNVKYKEDNESYRERIEFLENEINNLREDILDNQDEDVIVSYDREYSNLEEISVNELYIKMEMKENFILLLSQTQCGHCIAYKPVFNKILKENGVNAYEVNLTNITYDDRETLGELVKFNGTPTTLVFVDGVEDNSYRIVGNASEDKIIEKLSKAGYIK